MPLMNTVQIKLILVGGLEIAITGNQMTFRRSYLNGRYNARYGHESVGIDVQDGYCTKQINPFRVGYTHRLWANVHM